MLLCFRWLVFFRWLVGVWFFLGFGFCWSEGWGYFWIEWLILLGRCWVVIDFWIIVWVVLDWLLSLVIGWIIIMVKWWVVWCVRSFIGRWMLLWWLRLIEKVWRVLWVFLFESVVIVLVNLECCKFDFF